MVLFSAMVSYLEAQDKEKSVRLKSGSPKASSYKNVRIKEGKFFPTFGLANFRTISIEIVQFHLQILDDAPVGAEKSNADTQDYQNHKQ